MWLASDDGLPTGSRSDCRHDGATTRDGSIWCRIGGIVIGGDEVRPAADRARQDVQSFEVEMTMETHHHVIELARRTFLHERDFRIALLDQCIDDARTPSNQDTRSAEHHLGCRHR